MKYQAVFFDMDGVICDTNPYHSAAFNQFFKKRNIFTTEDDFIDHLYGKPNSYIFRHFLGDSYNPEDFYDLEDEKEGLFREIYRPVCEPVKGLIHFLHQLNLLRVPLGVATSAPRANMDMILDTLSLRSKFQSTLANEDITRHKPDPQIYLKSAQILGVDPSSCLVFEDSYSGSRAGIAAGMDVVGVLTTHTQEELPGCVAYINNFDRAMELMDL